MTTGLVQLMLCMCHRVKLPRLLKPVIIGQHGSLLFEFMLVAVLALALAVWGINEWVERTKALQAKSLAVWMTMANEAIQAYIDSDAAQIITALQNPSDTVVKPDWQDLIAASYLSPAWQQTGPLQKRLDYGFNISGDCNSGPCVLQALVYITTGLLDKNGAPDQSMLADWLMAVNGKGLVLRTATAAVFKGAGLSFPKPDGVNIQAGTVGLLATKNMITSSPDNSDDGSDNTALNNDYVRMRDERNPKLQGELTVAGDIVTGGNLVIENSAVPFNSCSPDGAISHNKNYPGLLVCSSGSWQQVNILDGGGFIFNTKYQCKNSLGLSTANPRTNNCTCPPTYMSVQISESGSLNDPNGLSTGYVCQYIY